MPLDTFLGKAERAIDGSTIPPPLHVRPVFPSKLPEALVAAFREDAVFPTLAPRYRGPYLVLDRQSKYFRLQIGSNQDSVSADCLKPAFTDDPITTFALRKTSPPTHGVFF